MKYNKVSIVGIGLIGGSIGLDLMEKGFAKEVVGWGRNPDHLRTAVKKGACISATTSLRDTLKDAEVVILCTPVEIIVSQLREIKPFLGDDVLLMDVGSVKEVIVNSADEAGLMEEGREFVGSHPMAGSEKTGVGNAVEGLFQGAPCIITPHEKNSPQAIERAKKFWENLGTAVVQMTPAAHDLTIGFVSHLPHVISSVLSKTCDSGLRGPETVARTAGASFTDLTRIAGASPQLWSQIYLQNRNQVLKAVDGFIESLKEFRKNLHNKDREKLERFINEAAGFRKEACKKEQG